jgi:NAD(P)-dependent dehydrogenase (short-subunit alcohol dehydrogenase family)
MNGGRVVLVTGGGRGLGRSHALALAAAGNRVVVNDTGAALDGRGPLDATVAEVVADEIRRAGGTAVADSSDVATHDGAAAVVERTVGEYGGLDAVVHSAGILRDRTFAKLDLADFDEVTRVHLGSPAYVTHAAWRALSESDAGRVVLTSSSSGLFGQFGQSNYGSAKAALVGLLNVLRLEGARSGIAVNAIAPVAASRMTESLLPAGALGGLAPERVSGLVAHLASAECEHSGLMLEVGAGLAARVRVMTSDVRALPRDGDAAGMGRLLDELVSLTELEGFDDSPSALQRLLDHASARQV